MAPPPIPNWQVQILKGIGAPATPQNLLYLNDWARAEGGNATNNPFNTTQPASGASSYNSVGVRNYGSPQQGIQATIQTLKNGRYGGIIGALQQGGSARAAADALAASPWGTGSLVQKMLGGKGSGAGLPVPVSPGDAGRAPAAPGGSPLLGQLLASTNQMVGLAPNPTLAGLLSGPSTAPTVVAAPAPGIPGVKGGGLAELLREGTGGPTNSTGPHIHAAFTSPQAELAAIAQAQKMGLHVGENPYVESMPAPGVHARNSYHYRNFPGRYNGKTLGEAIDVSGGNTAPFYQYLAALQKAGR